MQPLGLPKMADPLFIGNDNFVIVDKLKEVTFQGTFINTAVVTFNLRNANSTSVASGTAAYKTSSKGRYEGIIQNTTSLTEGAEYVLSITAKTGTTVVNFKRNMLAISRRGDED